MIELISVHTPKCAGTSLRDALIDIYTSEKIYFDYDDRPIDPAAPINIDPEGFFVDRKGIDRLGGKSAVHGHFNINKYRDERHCARITFLRNPIDRTISHYFFWMSLEKYGHTLHDYVVDNNLSFRRFIRLPLIRNFYTAGIFRGVDMTAFDFIGRYERYEDDLCRLGAVLGRPLKVSRSNVNPHGAYAASRAAILSDPELMSELSESLADDIQFYDGVLNALG